MRALQHRMLYHVAIDRRRIVMRIFRLHIDHHRLRENLSREEGRMITEQEISHWLFDAGFRAVGSAWIVHESDLGQLDPSEVLDADVVPESEYPSLNSANWIKLKSAAGQTT
jgi:hypothetical protein